MSGRSLSCDGGSSCHGSHLEFGTTLTCYGDQSKIEIRADSIIDTKNIYASGAY